MNLLLFIRIVFSASPNVEFRSWASGFFSLLVIIIAFFWRVLLFLELLFSSGVLSLSQIFWSWRNSIFSWSTSSWQWLNKLSRLWLLISSLILYLKVVSGKRDCNASSDDLPVLRGLVVFCLNFVSCEVTLKFVLLVQERQPGLDDLRSLESFGHVHLKSIQGYFPITSDFGQSKVYNLPCAGSHSDFDQNGFLLLIFLKH